MAKKTASKKKSAPAKNKPAKVSKPIKVNKPVKPAKVAKVPAKALKPVKSLKPVVKTEVKPAAKPVAKPAMMTKKGKVAPGPTLEPVIDVEPKKTSSIVSMIEADASGAEPAKAEKLSKVKPVKVDRGNLTDEKAKWQELNKKYGKDKAFNYKMTETYPTLIPLQHKVLGWGFVLSNENDRLEVLFENGIRMLISNYKS